MAADERNMPFIKHLASSDRKVRTKALETLRTFLSASTTSRTLSQLEHLKLWKGLFFSMWMCDRPIPQQNLATDLADLLTVLPDDAVAPWLEAFWEIVGREWTSIDVLRMEKFLLLVRRVFAASLKWVKEGGEDRNEAMLEVFKSWPFEGTGDLSKVPVGVRLHVLDIWVDEVERVGIVGDESTEADTKFLEALKVVIETQIKSPSKPVRVRAKEGLADDRLPWNESETKDDGEDNDSFGGFDD